LRWSSRTLHFHTAGLFCTPAQRLSSESQWFPDQIVRHEMEDTIASSEGAGCLDVPMHRLSWRSWPQVESGFSGKCLLYWPICCSSMQFFRDCSYIFNEFEELSGMFFCCSSRAGNHEAVGLKWIATSGVGELDCESIIHTSALISGLIVAARSKPMHSTKTLPI
jgi:hypothetical protein